jgi:hypothetical protein
MKKNNIKVTALPISLTDDTIHETTSPIADMRAINTAPAVITAIQFVPLSLIATVRTLGRVLFARNLTAAPRSICRKNKTLKRLDLGLGTSVVLAITVIAPVTSIDALPLLTYNMWPGSRASLTMRLVRTN